jgi:carbonic anhydrase
VVRFICNSIDAYEPKSALYLQGMVTFKDADLQEKLKKELHSTADHIAFLSIAKLEDSVRDDVDFLKNSSLLLKDVPVSGWLYDVKTGKLNRIV